MQNPVKEKLVNGEVAIGTFVGIGHADVTERLSVLGYDWLLLDGEHSPITFETMQSLMQGMKGNATVPIVRVQWNDPVVIKRVLDIGAYGVLVPMVNNKEEAEAAVQACKYPPVGIRGFAPRRAALVTGPNYFGTANDNILVAVQIETGEAVKNIDDILAVEGVDTAYIGPYDLSISMTGQAPNWEDPKYLEAFDIVLKAGKKACKPVGMFANSSNIDWAIEKGFKFVSIDTDDVFLMSAANRALKKAQEAVKNHS